MWKFFVLLFFVLGLGGGFLREYQSRKWDGLGRFTLINFLGNEVVVESVDSQTHEAIRIKLPSELQVSTVGGKGVWRVGVLPELFQKNGKKWAGDSIANFLGIAYTSLGNEINLWDKFNWWRISRNVSWKDVPLGETALVAETKEADDQKVLGLDSKWSNRVRDYFSSTDLNSEGIEVAVINSTSEDGLGASAARVVNSGGLRVVMVSSDTSMKTERCVVQGDASVLKTKSRNYLEKNFGCEVRESSKTRAGELELILGNDYAKWLNG